MKLFRLTDTIFVQPDHVMIARLAFPERGIFDVEFVMVDSSTLKDRYKSSENAMVVLRKFAEHCEDEQ